MRFIATTLALAGVASAYPPLSKAPASYCEVKTHTVYETAYASQGNGAKATPSVQLHEHHHAGYTPSMSTFAGAESTPTTVKDSYSQYESRPTGTVAKPFGQNKEYFSYNSGVDVNLQPCSHWSQDTKSPKNLVPKDKTQLYYAEGGRDNASK